MKKLKLFLTLLVLVTCSMGLWAGDVTSTMDLDKQSTTPTNTTTSYSATESASWTLSYTAETSSVSSDSGDRYYQIGSSSKTATSMTWTSSSFSGKKVKQVKIKGSTSGTSASVSVVSGSTTFTATTSTYTSSTAATLTFNSPTSGGDVLSNNLVVTIAFSSATKKNIRLFQIEVIYDGGGASLSSIAISGTPDKTVYEEGETFDPAGLVATGTYSDDSEEDLTSSVEWAYTPAGALTQGLTSVNVTATKGEIVGNKDVDITVNAALPKSSLIFTAACDGKGTASDGAKWTVTSDGAESTFDSGKGIHYGTGSASVQYIQLATSDITDLVKKVVVNASVGSGVSATVSVTVGGKAFGGEAKSLTTDATNYTFEGEATGEIIVLITKSESATKALYCKSIIVSHDALPTYAVSFEAPTGGTLAVKHGDDDVNSGDSFAAGEELTLTITPDTENHFTGGAIKVTKTGVTPEADVTAEVLSGTTLTIPSYPITIEASFTELYPITVEVSGSYVGKIRVNGSDFTQAYVTVWVADNTEVLNIEAKPDPGYNFKEWHIQAGGDAVALGSTTALSTTLSSSKIAVVQALFEHVCDYVDDFPTYLSTSNETHESAKIQWQWVWYPQSSFTKRVERYRVLVKETESGDVVFNDDVTFTQEEMEASSSVNHTVTGLKPVTEYSYWIWSRPTDDGFSTLGYCEDGASTDERTFTTNKAPAEIAWPNKKDTIYTVGKVRVPQTLLNPNNLPVTYESSSEYVATIDENTGVITPVNGGYTTTIWAFTEGDETHTYASVSYTLYVANPSAVKISGAPTKTTYELGETIDPTGLVAQVVYSDETLWTPESGVTFTFTPATIVEGQETAQAQAHWSDMDSYWSDSFDAICKKHHVTVADGIENGTVVVKDGTAAVTPTDFFYKGKVLTIEATPADAHYALDKIYINEVEHDGTSFEIPAGDDFVVSATFKHVKIDAPIQWYSNTKVEKIYGAPEWLNPFTWRTLVNEENLPVTVTSSNTDVIETMLKDDYNHWYPEAVKAIGTTTITATFEGNYDYNPTVVSYELEILKANAGLAWSAASAKVKKGAKAAVNVFPTLTKPSDLTATITYSSTDEDVAKIDANGAITLVADGETTIKAKFENDDKYADAEVSYTLTVEPRALITVTPALLDYGKVKTGTAASALDLLEFKFSSAENLTSGRAVSIVAPAGFSTSANELWPEISQNYGVSVYVKDATLSTAGVYEGNVVISTNDLEEDVIVAVKVTVEDAYAITEVSEGGSIEWNGSTAPESAFAGAVYTLVAKPGYSHEGGTIKVYKASDESEVPTEVFDGTTLTMPAYAIKVVATFLLPAANISWENTDKLVLKYGQDGILAQDNWKMLNNNSYFTVSVTSSNTDVIATMNGTSSGSQRYVPAEILGVGTTTITATFAGNDTYRETSVSYEVEIQKGDAGLAWSADEDIVAYLPEGVKAYELPTLSNPHDFAVTYTSGNESVAKIDEATGEITLVGEGASLIKASFAGNDLYASKEVAYILHVEVVNANFHVTGSGDALGNWNPAANPSYADTKVLHLAAGDYELKVVDGGDWKGYDALTSTPAGLSRDDANDNICFTLDEEGDVTVTYIKGSTFTVTGNFHVELPTKFYIAGSMTDWDANKIAVKADSYVLHLAAGHHQIKVVDGSEWKGFEDLTTKEGLYTDEWGNVAFTLTAEADVTVTYTSETFTVASTAFGEPTVKLVGFDNNWSDETTAVAFTSNGDGTASLTKSFSEACQFKLIVAGNWLGWSYDDQYWLTRTNTSVNNLISQVESGKYTVALYLNVDQAGEYTFTYNYVTRVLSVTFPEIPEPRLQNGYYLQLNGITVDDIEVTDKFTANSANEGEYLLADVTLHVGDKVKVISIVKDAIAWEFPKSGDGYEVDAAHAGVKTIYFNPDYQSGWADPFGGYIWIDANGGETGVDELNAADKAVKSLENGLLIIRRGDKSYNAQGQLIK